MKTIIVLFSIISVIFFFGCQENQITEPINTLEKTTSYLGGGVIHLDNPMADPLTGKSEVRGVVRYKMVEGLSNDQLNVAYKSTSRVKLTIEMDAELLDLTGPTTARRWQIKGTSIHNFTFEQDKYDRIYMTYVVTGRDDIVLMVEYGVEAYKLNILSMYLREL